MGRTTRLLLIGAMFAVVTAVVAGVVVSSDRDTNTGSRRDASHARELDSIRSLVDSGVPSVPPPPAKMAPDLGTFGDPDSLVAALRSSGPLNNEAPAAVAAGEAPARSICADILANREPTAGVVVHEARAAIEGDHAGLVFVLRRADGTDEVRLYSTGDADPTGACRLIFASLL